MSDEIYSQMLYDGRQHRSILSYDHLKDRAIMLDGWSKTYAMTGWRLGFAVWPKELAPVATRLAINCNSCVNASAQYAGIAALQGPQDEARAMVKAFDERRKVVMKALNDLPGFSCIEPAGAFYAFPNIGGTGLTAAEAQDLFLEKAGVATIAGTSFGIHGEGYIRVSYANSTANIRKAMSRMADVLAARG